MKRKPRKKTDAEIEGAKILVRELFTKFRQISSETQTQIIDKLSNFIENENHRKTKDFFIKLKMIFVEAAKTEVKRDEK